MRELGKTNYASQASTKHHIIKEGQALMYCNYDRRLSRNSIQIGPEHWMVWSVFYEADDDALKDSLYLYMTRFKCVRELKIKRVGMQIFVTCTCKKRIKTGIPCTFFLFIADNGNISSEKIMNICMVHVSFLHIFHSQYGKQSEISHTLLLA